MELPKNITQVGEKDRNCRVYVEDYVVSYIKQLNGHAVDKELAVAVYGIKKEEAGINYYFFYGAGRLNFLQKEMRHLSQAVLQEAEKIRKKYFTEYDFLGYRILNGEMVEGFHIYEQGICRFVSGYAQFYEKNDSMLQFMLSEREEEAKPEEFSREKYDVVRKRQEERRALAEEHRRGAGRRYGQNQDKRSSDTKYRHMKYSAAAVFVILCVAGIMTINGSEKIDRLQVAARQMIDEISVKKLPDLDDYGNNKTKADTIVAEDKLADAIRTENTIAQTAGTHAISVIPQDDKTEETPVTESEQISSVEPEATSATETQSEETTSEAETISEPVADTSATTISVPTAYIVQRGDTLIGICVRQYGDDHRLAEICELNQISDPDDIKFGEEILLPQ